MRETLKNIYDAYHWVRVATWLGLGVVALFVVWLEGGFPPPIWIVLWQTLHTFSLLWKARGVALIVPTSMIFLISLLWAASWLVLLRVCLGVVRHHHGLKMRQARKADWSKTRRITDLDPFELPGEHTLSLPVLQGEDDVTSTAILSPLIRLPQYSDKAYRADRAASIERTERTERIERTQRVAQTARSYPSASPVAIEDIPTTPEPPVRVSARTSALVRQAPASHLSSYPSTDALPRTLLHAVPRTPNPNAHTTQNTPTPSAPSIPPRTSAQRTIRLDTPAHTPALTQSRASHASNAKPVATSASLEAGVGWHTGLTRQRNPNEDSVIVLRGMCTYREQLVPFGLFVVADGMGGHDCGQEASRIAIRTITQVALRDLMQPETSVTLDDAQLTDLLTRAVQQANAAIYRHGQHLHKDMGTTLTAALVVDTKQAVMAYVVNAGDSRTYLFGQGEHLQQITRDHSLVANLVAAGAITPDAVYTHPERNKVYRSLGNSEDVELDWFTRELRPGDTLLLCSDGLWEMVRDPEIERILRQDADPTVLCNQLIQAALRGGGADNISAIVVKI